MLAGAVTVSKVTEVPTSGKVSSAACPAEGRVGFADGAMRGNRQVSSHSTWVARPAEPPDQLLLRLLDRPLGEHAGEVLLVLRAGAQVARRVETVRRMLGRLFRLGALLQRVLHGVRADRRRGHVREADAPVAVHLLGRHTDD